MYDDEDPVLVGLRRVALAFPEAIEVETHGRPSFRTRTEFAYLGGGVRGKPAGPRRDHALMVHLPPEETRALADDPRVFEPAYLGPSGWTGVDLDLPDAGGSFTTWHEVAELLDSSYRTTASRTLVGELDARIARGEDPVTTAPRGAVR